MKENRSAVYCNWHNHYKSGEWHMDNGPPKGVNEKIEGRAPVLKKLMILGHTILCNSNGIKKYSIKR